MPMVCTICRHPKADQIDTMINNGGSLRHTASQFDVGYKSVSRHIRKCRHLDMRAYFEEKRIKRMVDVYEEFLEQLEFAKALRVAAQDYLSDVRDPLRITIGPRADEIEVTYYDGKEITDSGPAKKTDDLQTLLDLLKDQDKVYSLKVQVKHIDMRKFALDCISSCDMVIDKFARIDGSYGKDKGSSLQDLMDELIAKLIKAGWEPAQAREFARMKIEGRQIAA